VRARSLPPLPDLEVLVRQSLLTAVTLLLLGCPLVPALAGPHDRPSEKASVRHARKLPHGLNVQVGPRPYALVDDMDESPLKRKLQSCAEGPFYKTDFSIGHRGAPLQFPEHTKESYEAAARMGAGVLECDVTFTKDRQLVCRHSQCDLHTTTNILATPLANKCSKPFQPADPATGRAASANCCTSDITLAEFKSLCGKMDASDPRATTVAQYLGGTAAWRTDLYATGCPTLLTHKESIELFDKLGAKFTPELKAPSVPMPFQGDYTQAMYAQQLVDEYVQAGVPPSRVFPQSFSLQDVLYWVKAAPQFGKQGVFLDARIDTGAIDPNDPSTFEPSMEELRAQGVRIVAPPMMVLLALDAQGRIVPSAYAKAAKAAGLDIVTWTLERSGPLSKGGGYYYATIAKAVDNDGDMLEVLDVLARDVGVKGVFSDWPGTVTYYASCMGLK
jgi:glycerophosphoryl diester phosphodiesterase